MLRFPFASVPRRIVAAIALSFTLGACAGGMDRDPTDGIHDPYEMQNRKVHEFNKSLDRGLVRPAARGYTSVLPDEVEDRVSDFARNLGEPAVVTNSLLQGNLRGASIATVRFVMNSTIGLFGFIDAASEFGIEPHLTDFDETLFVWGVGEGAYIELPGLGPSTQRHTAGRVVDLFTNPLSYAVGTPDAYYGTAASVAARLGDRGRFTDTIDAILYESADSYAQARQIYLQNRRFTLGDETETVEIDPFELDTEGF